MRYRDLVLMSEIIVKNIPKLRFPKFKDKPEWTEKPISKLLTIGSGRDYKHLSKGNIPVYGSGGYMLSVDEYLYDGESACIGRKGTINKPMFLTGKFWTVDTLFYTHSFKNCLPKFIYYSFLNINWTDYNEAGGIPSLSKTIIGKIKLQLPNDDDCKEQQKIADCLSSIDSLISSQNQKIELLKEHKKGLIQNLFPQEGESIPKLRFPEFENDGEWEEKKLEDIAKSESSSLALNKLTLLTSGYPVYGADSIVGYIDEFQQNEQYISIVKDGSGVGRLNLCSSNSSILGTLTSLKSKNKEKYNLKWIYYILNTIDFSVYTKGSGIPHIYYKDFKNHNITVPKLQEQQKITTCLSSVDEQINFQTKKSEELKEHKKALLQQLFPSNEVA